MKAIKTMTLTLIMLLTGSYAFAYDYFPDIRTKELHEETRPGDGKNKHNPRHKHGESLKGYFYRVYGDTVPVVDAKDVAFKGPFKRKKMKKFLKQCQKQNGDITADEPSVRKDDTYAIYAGKGMNVYRNLVAKVHHIALKSRFNCMVDGKQVSYRESVAVYLDRDEEHSVDKGIYVDYDGCDSDDRAHLSTGEYSIHYDDNIKCRADLDDVSED